MPDDIKIAVEAEIRVLTQSDLDAFWKLRLRALQEEPESFEDAYEESVNIPQSEIARRLHSSDDSFILGAFAPGLIGMVGYYRRTGIKVRHKGLIWGMYVTKEARGKKLGKALMAAVITQTANISSLEQLHLAVSTHNTTARNLYLSLGFTSYGIEPHAKKLGDDYTDRDLMMLKLNQ